MFRRIRIVVSQSSTACSDALNRLGWLEVGMKTDGNGWEDPSTISVSVFYYGKRERERNSWVRERKRDITVTETDGNRKIYRNALVFNHHSFCMNITLDTPLHKLFFKNMINISCFLLLNREVHVLMLMNMREYMMCLLFFLPDFFKYGIIPAKNEILQILAGYTPSHFPYHFRIFP